MTKIPDKSAHDIGESLLKAQEYILASSAKDLPDRLDELSDIVTLWAMHPARRNWDLVDRLERFVCVT